MGITIHKIYPDIDVQTSCNAYIYNVRQMDYWNEKCGTTTFNPAREVTRMPSILKTFKNRGYRIKCIVNEACLFGCPVSITHVTKQSDNCHDNKLCVGNCYQDNLANIFRSNYLIPRWLKYYDKYIDIYKIAPRTVSTDTLNDFIDCYVNEKDDEDLCKFTSTGTISNFNIINHNRIAFKKLNPIQIKCKDVPDKLMTCECKRCNTCKICEERMNEVIERSNNTYTWDKKLYH